MPENDKEKTLVSNMLYTMPKHTILCNFFETHLWQLLDTYVYVGPLFSDSMTMPQKLLDIPE